MSKLIRYLIDFLYKQYLFEQIPLPHTETIHVEPFSFEFEKYSRLAHFPSIYNSMFTYAVILSIHACRGLPDFANKDTGCLVKFKFQINNNFLYKYVSNIAWDIVI